MRLKDRYNFGVGIFLLISGLSYMITQGYWFLGYAMIMLGSIFLAYGFEVETTTLSR